MKQVKFNYHIYRLSKVASVFILLLSLVLLFLTLLQTKYPTAKLQYFNSCLFYVLTFSLLVSICLLCFINYKREINSKITALLDSIYAYLILATPEEEQERFIQMVCIILDTLLTSKEVKSIIAKMEAMRNDILAHKGKILLREILNIFESPESGKSRYNILTEDGRKVYDALYETAYKLN